MSVEEWNTQKLEDVIIFNPRESIRKNDLATKVTMQDLEPYNKKIKNWSKNKFSGGTKFKNADTLLARITPCLENGKTAFVDILEENEVGFGSTEFIVMRAIDGLMDENYIYYLSISPSFRKLAIQSMSGSSGRQRVQLDVIKKERFKIPPLEEQKAISKILSTIDDKIELNNQINQDLEEMAQAIFRSWFIDFEPFQEGEFVESELGKIPKGWRVGSLSAIANYINGLAMQKYRPKGEDFLPVIKIKEMRQGCTNDSSERATTDLDEKYIVNNGDVLFSWSGTLLVKVWTGGRGALNQHIFKVTSKKYKPWFYYYWTKFHLNRFVRIAKYKTTTMGHIRRKDLEESKIVIPDQSNYNKINKIIEPLFKQQILLNLESQNLAQLRDILLPKLISGELRIPTEEGVES